jgi:hypothetical protein
MKMKTSELTGTALDWAVAECERDYGDRPKKYEWAPSEKWEQGGPIIEREKIVLLYDMGVWEASLLHEDKKYGGVMRTEKQGTTPLIAAMRCYVASKLGDEVEVPTELKGA